MESIYTTEKPAKIPFAMRALRLYFRSLGPLLPEISSRLLWRLFTRPRARKIRSKHAMLMEKAQITQVAFEGLDLQVYQWGSGPHKILLIHGWESFAADHHLLIEKLLHLGYQIIAPDMPAHGRSGGAHSNLPQFKRTALHLAQTFGPFETVIGHSLGAAASTFMLTEYAQAGHVRKFISIGAPVEAIRFFIQFANLLGVNDKLYEYFVDFSSRKVNGNVHQYSISTMKNQVGAREVILFHDRRDEIIPFDEQAALAEAWPKARLIETNHGGHFRNFKHPVVVDQIVELISEKVPA